MCVAVQAIFVDTLAGTDCLNPQALTGDLQNETVAVGITNSGSWLLSEHALASPPSGGMNVSTGSKRSTVVVMNATGACA